MMPPSTPRREPSFSNRESEDTARLAVRLASGMPEARGAKSSRASSSKDPNTLQGGLRRVIDHRLKVVESPVHMDDMITLAGIDTAKVPRSSLEVHDMLRAPVIHDVVSERPTGWWYLRPDKSRGEYLAASVKSRLTTGAIARKQKQYAAFVEENRLEMKVKQQLPHLPRDDELTEAQLQEEEAKWQKKNPPLMMDLEEAKAMEFEAARRVARGAAVSKATAISRAYGVSEVAVMSINGEHLSPHESTLGLVALAAKNEQLTLAATPRIGARGGFGDTEL